MKIPTDLLDDKLPRWGTPPTADEHPNPKFRRFKGGQEFTKVDKRTGEHIPPKGGLLPTVTGRGSQRPARRRG